MNTKNFVKRIVICGSISFYSEFIRIQRILRESDILSLIPTDDDEIKNRISEEMFQDYKRKASFDHIKKIRDPRTFGILAVNFNKYDILHYIGPNTFAEVAVAFAQSKRIYLLNGIPNVYEDELLAWRVIPLFGDLQQLIDDFHQNYLRETSQLQLFDKFSKKEPSE